MVGPVFIQGLPEAAEVRATVLSTCSNALAPRVCSADDGAASPERPGTVVAVLWTDGSARRVRVVLERGQGGEGSPPSPRDVVFAEEDPPLERSRALGLVIAALVGETAPQRANGPEDGGAKSVASERARPLAHFVGAAFLVGPGLRRGPPRAGVAFEAGIDLAKPIFLAASMSYALRTSDDGGLAVRWLTVGAGPGVRGVWPIPDLVVGATVQLCLQSIAAELDVVDARATGKSSRLVPGLTAALFAGWPASAPLRLNAALALTSWSGGTHFRVDERNLGSSAWLTYTGALGVTWNFR